MIEGNDSGCEPRMMVRAYCEEQVLMNVEEEWYTDDVYPPLRRQTSLEDCRKMHSSLEEGGRSDVLSSGLQIQGCNLKC